jgi:hypothetical protein
MLTQVEIVLLILVLAAVYGFIGTILWRMMRAQEAIARYLADRADIPAPTPTLAPKRNSFENMRKELEERRRIAEEQEGD